MEKYSPRALKFFSWFAFAVAIVVIAYIFVQLAIIASQPRFYTTLERAFFWREFSLMGEITFIDEHEDSVTVRHVSRTSGLAGVAHFMRKVENDAVLFSCVGVTSGGIPLNSDVDSIKQYQIILSSIYRYVGHPRFDTISALSERINRNPLYGLSSDSNIHNLRINGQAVDYVIVSNVHETHTVYFWYFSDFQFEPGDEIVITFD